METCRKIADCSINIWQWFYISVPEIELKSWSAVTVQLFIHEVRVVVIGNSSSNVIIITLLLLLLLVAVVVMVVVVVVVLLVL